VLNRWLDFTRRRIT